MIEHSTIYTLEKTNFIEKRKTYRNTILPALNVLQVITKGTEQDRKNKKTYKINNIESIQDICILMFSNQSVNELGQIVMSQSYRRKKLRHFQSPFTKTMFNNIYKLEYLGNSYQGIASSYSKIYSKGHNEFLNHFIYVDEKVSKKLISDWYYYKITDEQYKSEYNRLVKKAKKKFKNRKHSKFITAKLNMELKEHNLKTKKVSVYKQTDKLGLSKDKTTILPFDNNSLKLDNLNISSDEKSDNLLSSSKEEPSTKEILTYKWTSEQWKAIKFWFKEYNSKKTPLLPKELREYKILQTLIEQTDGKKRLHYINSTSKEFFRRYNILTNMPKTLRHKIFEDMTEFDLSNAAYSTVLAYLESRKDINPKEYEGIKYYVENRDKVIEEIDEILKPKPKTLEINDDWSDFFLEDVSSSKKNPSCDQRSLWVEDEDSSCLQELRGKKESEDISSDSFLSDIQKNRIKPCNRKVTIKNQLEKEDYLNYNIKGILKQFFLSVMFGHRWHLEPKVVSDFFVKENYKENKEITYQLCKSINVLFKSHSGLKKLNDNVKNLKKKYFNNKKNEYSKIFMRQETILIDKIKDILQVTNQNSVQIHDAIFVPTKLLKNPTLETKEQFDKLETLGCIIKNIEHKLFDSTTIKGSFNIRMSELQTDRKYHLKFEEYTKTRLVNLKIKKLETIQKIINEVKGLEDFIQLTENYYLIETLRKVHIKKIINSNEELINEFELFESKPLTNKEIDSILNTNLINHLDILEYLFRLEYNKEIKSKKYKDSKDIIKKHLIDNLKTLIKNYKENKNKKVLKTIESLFVEKIKIEQKQIDLDLDILFDEIINSFKGINKDLYLNNGFKT